MERTWPQFETRTWKWLLQWLICKRHNIYVLQELHERLSCFQTRVIGKHPQWCHKMWANIGPHGFQWWMTGTTWKWWLRSRVSSQLRFSLGLGFASGSIVARGRNKGEGHRRVLGVPRTSPSSVLWGRWCERVRAGRAGVEEAKILL